MEARRGIPGPLPVRGRFAIRAAHLYDGSGGPATAHPLVVVEDGGIVWVEDATRAGDPGCPVIDAPGSTILPGLIDPHTHLWWQEPGERIDPPGSLLLAADHAARALAGGTTTARDLGGPGDAPVRLRDAIAAGIVAGPRMLVAGPPITTPAGHCHWFGRHAVGAAEARAAVRANARLGVDVIKLMVTGGMSTPTTDPYAPQYPPDVARAVVEEAHGLGLPVAAHALGTPGVRQAIDVGVDTLEHGWTITGRDHRFDPTVLPELRHAGLTASVTAHHALRELLPGAPEGGTDVLELRRRLAPHRAAAAAGVPMVVHSDCGPGPTRHDGFGESLMAFLLGMETSVGAAVHAGTFAPARALGLASVVGAVRAGLSADLVLLDGDPEADLDALRRIRDVWQGGRHVAHRGALVVPPLSDGTAAPEVTASGH